MKDQGATLEQECVIGGFTEPRGSRSGFGSLLLGLYQGGKNCSTWAMRGRDSTRKCSKANRRPEKHGAQNLAVLRRCRSQYPVALGRSENGRARSVSQSGRATVLRQPAFLRFALGQESEEQCVRERPIDTDDIVNGFQENRGRIDGRSRTFSNLDKVLWPRTATPRKISSHTIGAMYRNGSFHILGWPFTLQRWPDGIDHRIAFSESRRRV